MKHPYDAYADVPRLKGCSHIVSCTSKEECETLEEMQIKHARERHGIWERSRWGNLGGDVRMSMVWHDLYEALGNLTIEQMRTIRLAMGDEQFRLLLNAYERTGGHILDVPEVWSEPRVLP